ncbi:MAG: hypothetical protein RIR97_402 [Pseudomonadota bacterium]
MASKHKQEDPWAGFVDVLSNILMVVIFLVVILGISIFAISQQVTKAAVEKAVQQEREKATEKTPPPPTPAPASPDMASKTASATPAAGGKSDEKPPPEAKPAEEGERGASGDRAPDQGLRVRESDDIAGQTNLSIRSRKVKDEKSIDVVSEEVEPKVAAIEVKSSQALLTLNFGKGSFRLDQKTTDEIKTYLADTKDPTKKIEIRAFAQSTVGSVSEARRIAFYRAMLVRTELVKNGIPTNNINVIVRESVAPEEADSVRIFEKT